MLFLLLCTAKCRTMADPKAKKNRVYTAWTPEMDSALLSVLVDHDNSGDHAQNGWKPHVYTACIKHVKEVCNVEIAKDNIRGRIKTFDKQYEIVSKMLAQSGFGWDWETNTVTVDSDEVWSQYVEVLKISSSFVVTFACTISSSFLITFTNTI